MFERYTERARRVIFFARYEASQLGSPSIETEHLLLGLIREGKGLTSRLFSKNSLPMEEVRKEIEGRSPYREKVSTSVDIPLSADSKRVLGYAAEEAERMLHNYIGTEHILLGLMREESSVAATILAEKGMRLPTVREDIVAIVSEKAATGRSKETPLLSEFSRDLTERASRGDLDPLVGREEELERTFMVEIRAEVRNKLGVLAAVAANISATETNIEHVDVVERDGDTSSLTFLLQVRNRSHLDRVLKSIKSMPDVLDVIRTST